MTLIRANFSHFGSEVSRSDMAPRADSAQCANPLRRVSAHQPPTKFRKTELFAVQQTSPFTPHSIINERSKLLIRKGLEAAPKIFTVIFTVNLSGTSIGAGLRAIRPKLTFRDLLRSINSRNDHRARRRRHRRAPGSIWKVPQKGRHRIPQAIVPIHFFAHNFTVTYPQERGNAGALMEFSTHTTRWYTIPVVFRSPAAARARSVMTPSPRPAVQGGDPAPSAASQAPMAVWSCRSHTWRMH